MTLRKTRIQEVTIAQIQTEIEVNEDASEQRFVWTPDGYFDEAQHQAGAQQELQAMKKFDVYDEVDTSAWSAAEKKALVATKWVMAQKTPESVRARLVCKGFKEQIDDKDTVFAATPNFSTLMALLTVGLATDVQFHFMDISTAFLHAPVQHEVYAQPPSEATSGSSIAWKLKRAMYGLRSAPASWQIHFSSLLQEWGFTRLKTCLLYTSPSPRDS